MSERKPRARTHWRRPRSLAAVQRRRRRNGSRGSAYRHARDPAAQQIRAGHAVAVEQRRADAVHVALRGRRFRGLSHDQSILGVQRLGTAARRGVRQTVLVGEHVQPRVRAGQVMRHELRGAGNLRDVLALRRPHLLAGIEHPALAAHEWLREHRRVVDDRDHGEELAVPHPVLGQRAARRRRNTVAAQVVGLQMRRGDREHIAVPHARREPLPRMRRFGRRMRAAVEPDRAFHGLKADARVERDQALRGRIDLRIDAQRGEPAHRIVGAVLAALVFGDDGDAVCVVAVGAQPRSVVYG